MKGIGRPRGRRPVTEPVVRFLRRLDVDADRLCWLWTGPGRYFYVDETSTVTVRRFAFEYWRGPIPARYEVVPRCGVVRCVNPDHLTVADKATRELMVAAALDDVRPRCRGFIITAGQPNPASDETPRTFRELDRCSVRCDDGHWVLGDNAITKTDPNGEVHRRCKSCKAEQDRARGALTVVPDLSGETVHDRFVVDRLARLLGVAS